MSGPYKVHADEVMSNITGTRDAQHLVHSIRQGGAPADALRDALVTVYETGDEARLRGFARVLQKTLELL